MKVHLDESSRMKKGAKISDCSKYRYALWRKWDESKPTVMFIGLNPSTADATDDDPTLTRCINFAKSWGYGALNMANLFAFRATKPSDMFRALDPIGNRNNYWLKRLYKNSDLVVAAWGNDGIYLHRSKYVKEMLTNLHYLKLNASNEPAHPLYLKANLKPKSF